MSGENEQRRTLLLVEDEAIIAAAEAAQLRRNGFAVAVVYDGESAVAAVQGGTAVDLILMDINLGAGMDGPEAARRILETYDIPIVFLSSHTEPEVVTRTEAITSYGYVVKDSGETVLLASIRMAFRLHEAKRRLKERERILQESEERFSLFMKYFPGAAFIKDRGGKVLFANPFLQELFGWGENVGKLTQELLPQPFADRMVEDDRRALEEGCITVSELVQDHLGRERIFDTYKFAIPGNLGGMMLGGISVETTERIRMEDALRESEARHRALLQALPDLIFQIRRDGTVLAFSGPEHILFTTPGAIVGNSISRLLPQDLARTTMEKIERALCDGEVQILSYSGVSTDGTPRTFEARMAAYTADEVLIIVHDISEYIRAGEEARETMNKFLSLYNNMSEGVALHELIRDQAGRPVNYRIIETNPQYERILGIRQADILGRTADQAYGTPAPPYLEEYAGVVESGRPHCFETYFPPLDKFFSISVSPWLHDGFATIFTDITARRRAEEALARAAEEKALHYRELQHRVKNSLTMIRSLIELEMSQAESAAVQGVLKELRDRIHSLSTLYTILGQSGAVREIRLDQYLPMLTASLLQSYTESQHRLEVRQEYEPVTVAVSRAATIGIIVNEVVTNSLKYAFADGRHGTLAIALRRPEPGLLLLEIHDNGIGLPEHVIPHRSAGRGMQLVQMLAGQLAGAVEFCRHQGTLFRLQFPVQP